MSDMTSDTRMTHRRDTQPLFVVKEAPETSGTFGLLPRQRGAPETPTTFSDARGFVWPTQHPDYMRIGGTGDVPVWFGLYMERVDPRNGVSGELQLAVMDLKRQLQAYDVEVVHLRVGCEWSAGNVRFTGKAHEYHFKMSHLEDRTVAQLVPWRGDGEDNYQGPGAWYWRGN